MNKRYKLRWRHARLYTIGFQLTNTTGKIVSLTFYHATKITILNNYNDSWKYTKQQTVPINIDLTLQVIEIETYNVVYGFGMCIF